MSTSTVLSRSALRFTRFHASAASRRHASNQAEAAQKKAQEVLTSAQQNAGKVLESLGKILEPVGQRIGQLLGSYKQPLLYNLAVTRELAKQVYVAEGLQPPTLGAVYAAYETLWTRAISTAYWRSIVRSGDFVRVGIYGVEAYTIFKVGEIIGRRSLVGYKVE